MTDRVDASVNGVEAADPHPVLDLVDREPASEELRERDHAVLASSHPSDLHVRGWATFGATITPNVAHPLTVTECGARKSCKRHNSPPTLAPSLDEPAKRRRASRGAAADEPASPRRLVQPRRPRPRAPQREGRREALPLAVGLEHAPDLLL